MPEWIVNLGIVLGVIGSIFSIIGLPITIWQVHAVKSKQKALEDALKNYEDQRKAEIIKNVLEILNKVSQLILDLQSASVKQGYDLNGKNANQCIKNIKNLLNNCLYQLPANLNEIVAIIQAAIGLINNFSNDTSAINMAYLEVIKVISLLKNEQEKYIDASIKIYAKANQ